MIILDIETSGLYSEKHGIVSIGAVDFFKNRLHYDECRIDETDEIDEAACRINGFTKEQMRDLRKKTQAELIKKFIEWSESCSSLIIAGENPSFDLGFIKEKAKKYSLTFPFSHRSYDLHTLSQTRQYEIYGCFKIEKGKSGMSLDETLKFCGLEPRQGTHNALEDAELEAECFSRLLRGKGIFPDYEKFPIPEYLKQNRGEK